MPRLPRGQPGPIAACPRPGSQLGHRSSGSRANAVLPKTVCRASQTRPMRPATKTRRSTATPSGWSRGHGLFKAQRAVTPCRAHVPRIFLAPWARNSGLSSQGSKQRSLQSRAFSWQRARVDPPQTRIAARPRCPGGNPFAARFPTGCLPVGCTNESLRRVARIDVHHVRIPVTTAPLRPQFGLRTDAHVVRAGRSRLGQVEGHEERRTIRQWERFHLDLAPTLRGFRTSGAIAPPFEPPRLGNGELPAGKKTEHFEATVFSADCRGHFYHDACRAESRNKLAAAVPPGGSRAMSMLAKAACRHDERPVT